MVALSTPPRPSVAQSRALAFGAAAVVGFAFLVCLATGVDVSELVRFAVYQAAIVFAPGIAAYLALVRRPGDPVRVLTLGWTLGLAIEVIAFIATAALGVRDLFLLCPLLVLAVSVPAAWRHTGGVEWSDVPSPRAVATGVGLLGVTVLYLVAGPFVDAPLPDHASSVAYYVDSVFDISLVGEALHHWPLQNPTVAGQPLRYHMFAFLEMGATSQVSGVEPSTLVLRLFPLSITVLSFLHMTCLGRRVGGRWAVGVLAAGLLFVAGELDFDPNNGSPFAGTFGFATFASPTFLFALPFFLGATLLVCDMVERGERVTARESVLLAVLVVLAVGAKASAVPVLLGGLVLLAVWCALRCRERLRDLVVLAVAVGVVFLVAYSVIYSGGEGALKIKLFEFLRLTVPGSVFPAYENNPVLGAVLSVPTIVAGYVALVGVAWFWPLTRAPLTVVFLLGLFVASLGPSFVVAVPGSGQLYFLLYGIAAAVAVGAAGLARAWERAREAGIRARPVATAAAVVMAIGVVGGAVLWNSPAERTPTPTLVAFYLLMLGAAAGLALVIARRRGLWTVAAVASLLVVAATLVDRPVDILPAQLQAVADGVPANPVDEADARGTTRELTDGLRWVRDNTPSDALLAVNVHLRRPNDSTYFYFSAFTERRVFLESWSYTPEGAAEDAPASVFPDREAVNDGAILDGDRGDLDELRRRGVRYVLVDRVHGTAAPALDGMLERVFGNRALTVYRL